MQILVNQELYHQEINIFRFRIFFLTNHMNRGIKKRPYEFLQPVYQVVIIYMEDNHWNWNIFNNISLELFYDNLTVTSA